MVRVGRLKKISAMVISFLLLFSSFSIIFQLANAELANLLINPGFEDQLNYWSVLGGNTTYTVDNNDPHGGIWCLKGIQTSPESYSWQYGVGFGLVYQHVTDRVVPGRNYKISGWIKKEDFIGTVAIGLAITYGTVETDEGYEIMLLDIIEAIEDREPGTTGWTYYESAPFVLPEPSEAFENYEYTFFLDLGPLVPMSIPTAWWDDVSLRELAVPVASLSASPTIIKEDIESVKFDASASYDPDRIILYYWFDYGDGFNSGWVTESVHYRSYPNPGEYQAKVRVRDDDGLISDWSSPVQIKVLGKPVAFLTGSPTAVKEDIEEVKFDASSSYDPDGSVVLYWYDYGDGFDSGWISEPVHFRSYPEPGEYYARVKVKDNEGLVSDWSTPVKINVEKLYFIVEKTNLPSNPKIIADIDNDGVMDYCYWNETHIHVYHYINGAFEHFEDIPGPLWPNNSSWLISYVAVGDIDNNGLNEIYLDQRIHDRTVKVKIDYYPQLYDAPIWKIKLLKMWWDVDSWKYGVIYETEKTLGPCAWSSLGESYTIGRKIYYSFIDVADYDGDGNKEIYSILHDEGQNYFAAWHWAVRVYEVFREDEVKYTWSTTWDQSDGWQGITSVRLDKDQIIFKFGNTMHRLVWNNSQDKFELLSWSPYPERIEWWGIADANEDGSDEIYMSGAFFVSDFRLMVSFWSGTSIETREVMHHSKVSGIWLTSPVKGLAFGDANNDGSKELYVGYLPEYQFGVRWVTLNEEWIVNGSGPIFWTYSTYSQIPYGFQILNLDGMNKLLFFSEGQAYLSYFPPKVPSHEMPIAILSASPTIVDVGEYVTFDASASYDLDGNVEYYWFDYGDGSDSGWVSSPTITHSYTETGVYHAKLKVRDNDGLESKWSKAIEIKAPWYPSKYVKDGCKVASFDMVKDWVWTNCVPLVLMNSKSHFSLLKPPLVPPSFPPDADTKLQDPDHRPDWSYRVVVDENNKQFVVQFIGNWTYQYAGIDVCSFIVGEHPWDYEPIFLYYKYSGNDFFSSLKNDEVEYQYVFHPVWHGYVDTLIPFPGDGTDADAKNDGEKLHFWQDDEGKKHPVFVIGMPHEIGGTIISTNWLASWAGHAYGHVRRKGHVGISVLYPVTGDDIVDWKFEWGNGYEDFWPKDKNFDQVFKDQHIVRLTDEVISEWESRSENPFKMTPLFGSQDLINPWNEKYKNQWPSIGEKFDPVEMLTRRFGVLAGSPLMLYIIDPEGRHIGIDPSTGELVNEIPDATYTMIDDRFQSVTIPNPLDGDYVIVLLGTGVGDFSIMTALSALLNISERTYSGTMVTGQVLSVSVTISEDTLISSAPARVPPTMASKKLSMVQFVKLEMEWLTTSLQGMNIEEDVKEGLLDKLINATLKADQAIQWIYLNKEKQANNMLNSAINIMDAFLNQVYAQTNKAISEHDAECLIVSIQGVIEDLKVAVEKKI